MSTVLEDCGGYLIKGIQDVFPEQKADRSHLD
jgi:hypothetical protein